MRGSFWDTEIRRGMGCGVRVMGREEVSSEGDGQGGGE